MKPAAFQKLHPGCLGLKRILHSQLSKMQGKFFLGTEGADRFPNTAHLHPFLHKEDHFIVRKDLYKVLPVQGFQITKVVQIRTDTVFLQEFCRL